MDLYEDVARLPLTVESVDLERRSRDTSSGFTRVTTVVSLRDGEGHVGRGEDVTYDEADHDAFLEWAAAAESGEEGDLDDLAGEYTVASFSRALGERSLFPEPPDAHHAANFRRWAFESAALDLALRQAGLSLGDAIGRSYDPLTFVASARLGEPPTAERVHALLDRVPHLGFKLDPTPEWDDDLVAELAATGAVRIIDLKGLYEDTEVDVPADPDYYRRIAAGLPDAIVEDPGLTAETWPFAREVADRLAWDFPIVDVASYRTLAADPGGPHCNVKPSRFGTLAALFSFLEHCLERGVTLYGGGQFELDVGRGQIQALASLLYPDGPNDVAPRSYNDPAVPDDPPAPPLDPAEGFAAAAAADAGGAAGSDAAVDADHVGFGFRSPDW